MTLLQFNADTILEDWKVDSKIIIDDMNSVKSESLRVQNVHHKYLSYLKDINRTLYLFEQKYAILFKNKSLYYEKDGFYTKEQLDKFGWDYDPFEGLVRPKTKDKLKIYFDADKDLLDLKSDIQELNSMYEIVKHILKSFDNFTFFFNNLKVNE
jgi:hypothetical protein